MSPTIANRQVRLAYFLLEFCIDVNFDRMSYQSSQPQVVIGPYKEQAADPDSYNRKLEAEGSADIPRATVSISLQNGQANYISIAYVSSFRLVSELSAHL